MTNSITRVFGVWFKDLGRWDVKFFLSYLKGNFPFVVLAPFIHERSERVNLFEFPEKTFRILGVNNTEGVFHAYDAQGKLFNQPYKRVRAGDFFYNPYRVNVGSVGIVPDDLDGYFVSPAYVVFTVHESRILPKLLEIILKSKWYNPILRSATAGSVRQNLTFDLLKTLRIPLPPIQVQETILKEWRKAQNGLSVTKKGLTDLIEELNHGLYSLYHRICKQDVIGTRFFVLDFKDLNRWDVKSSRSSAFRTYCREFRPMGDFIEDATELVRPFDEPEKEWPIYGVNNEEGVFFNTYQKGTDFNAPYKRIRKDWFFHNPTRCNVGSLGIVPDVPEDAITSPEYQVWRLKDNDSKRLLPGYVALLIQTPFFLELVQFNRVGAVKQRMYYENLCEICIPYSPESEQRRYSKEREKALEDIQKARTNLEQMKKEIEEMILGIRPVK